MSKAGRKKTAAGCPMGMLFAELERLFGSGSEIGGHLKRSQLELLKALRAWADERSEHLESGAKPRPRKKVTKVRVE